MKTITFRFGYLSRTLIIFLYFFSFPTSLGLQNANFQRENNQIIWRVFSNVHEIFRKLHRIKEISTQVNAKTKINSKRSKLSNTFGEKPSSYGFCTFKPF